MAFKIKLSSNETKLLWNSVKEIIKDHYVEIMNKSKSLRDSFYIVRRYLAEYQQVGKITPEIYNLFDTEEDAYRYYTQDIWTCLERIGFKRPDAKPVGICYWEENTYTTDLISSYLPQARGFIYVEKEGIADKIKEISNYGWVIVASQGQATRQIRKLIKRTGKPCLIVHDYDPDGETISNSIIHPTRRTTHLNLENSNAKELILNDDQINFLVEYYNVPTQPLPNKWVGKWKRDYRVELSAFTVIDTHSGNAVLDFVKSQIKKLEYSLSLNPLDKKRLLTDAVKDTLNYQIEDILTLILRDYKIDGEACKCELTEDIDISKDKEIYNAIKKAVKGIDKKCGWITESDMEEEALEKVPSDFINLTKNSSEKHYNGGK